MDTLGLLTQMFTAWSVIVGGIIGGLLGMLGALLGLRWGVVKFHNTVMGGAPDFDAHAEKLKSWFEQENNVFRSNHGSGIARE